MQRKNHVYHKSIFAYAIFFCISFFLYAYVVYGQSINARVLPESGKAIHIYDHEISYIGGSKVEIDWKTNYPAHSEIQYEDTKGNANNVAYSQFVWDHRVILEGLEPNTTYTYYVVSQTEDDAQRIGPFSFTTHDELFYPSTQNQNNSFDIFASFFLNHGISLLLVFIVFLLLFLLSRKKTKTEK